MSEFNTRQKKKKKKQEKHGCTHRQTLKYADGATGQSRIMRENRRGREREKKNKEQMFYLEEDFRDRIT